ncbi:MAG: hypothetical protein N2C14_02225, partial [Planctomycetales bacterium]
LDADSAEPNPLVRFAKTAEAAILAVSSLPKSSSKIQVRRASALERDFSRRKTKLIICHPPYFNVYRYSRVFSLETAWLGHELQPIRGQEVREFFKVGKPDNVTRWVEDMRAVLVRVARGLADRGVLALMVGDAVMKGQRIPAARLLLEAVQDFLKPVKIAVRPPKFTEASWAASQRRTGDQVGVPLADFVILLQGR